jgi:hypothetical protein
VSDDSIETADPHALAAQALDLLTEALALLDAAMAHQPAALTDLAINMLGGWAGEQAVDGTGVSTLLH